MSGSLTFIGLGATHPRPDQMMTIDQTARMLERNFGTHIEPKDLETMFEIGMRKRWISNSTSFELLAPAVQEACNWAEAIPNTNGFNRRQIGITLGAGASLPKNYPAQSMAMAGLLGLDDWTFQAHDVPAACSSWTKSVCLAAGLMHYYEIRYGLIGIGEVIVSRGADPRFGRDFLMWDDNGAATVLYYNIAGNSNYGVLGKPYTGGSYKTDAESIGSGSDYIRPIGELSNLDNCRYKEYCPDARLVDGPALYRFLIRKDTVAARILHELEIRNIEVGKRVFLAPHGANLKMVDKINGHIGFDPGNILTLLGEGGRSNMSSASIPTALEHYSSIPGFFQHDDVIVMVSFAAGVYIDVIIYRVGESDYFTANA